MNEVIKAAGYIKSKLTVTAQTGLVLGSGLGNYADGLSNASVIHYKDVPGMPVSTVQGHKGCVCNRGESGQADYMPSGTRALLRRPEPRRNGVPHKSAQGAGNQ